MTMPPSGDQPAYVDPVTGQPLFIDPATGQLAYTDPTAASPAQLAAYPPVPDYPSAAPTYPGYAMPTGFPPAGYPTGDPTAAGMPASPYGTPVAGYTAPAYTPGYPGFGYPMQALQRRTNSMAITAMILSIVGAPMLFCYGVGGLLGVAGAILGHIALKQTKQRGEEGGGMALAGIIVGWIDAAIGVAIIIFLVWFFTSLPGFENIDSNP